MKLIFGYLFINILRIFGISLIGKRFSTTKMESESYYSDVYGSVINEIGSPSANGGILLLSYLFYTN